MRLKQVITSLLLSSLSFIWGCSDVFEEDIANGTIVLLTPGDSIVSKNLSQQFQWEEFSGANEYRFQIASPTLERPAEFYLDTVIEQNDLRLNLVPGKYQWRVQGRNSGYETSFSTRSLIIDSSATLANQPFNLLSPAQGAITSNSAITFKWENVPSATKYLFQLLTNPAFDTIVNTNQFKKTFPLVSKSYSWKVTALNALSLKESPTFHFSIDVTSPGIPNLRYPSADTAFLFFPVTFSWSRSNIDVSHDSLFLYDNLSRLVANFPVRVNGNSYNLTSSNFPVVPGTYFWAVKSVDKAGNQSQITNKRRFYKQ